MPEKTFGAAAPPFDPLEEELQISARLLVHIAKQPRLHREDNGLQHLTQEGMAQVLRTTPASVSHALGRLTMGGLLFATRRHVSGRSRRVRVYELTPEGEGMARYILSRMASHASTTTRQGIEVAVQLRGD